MANETFTDPLGRTVTLHDHTWYGHVLIGHREMHGRRGELGPLIRRPARIHFSNDADSRLYYRTVARDGMMTAVVADVVRGIVKTAYRTKRTRGAQEWP